MIVLDTNVLSELMRPERNGGVTAWVEGQPPQSLYTTSITQAEILHGVMLLPSGRRRKAFEAATEAMFREDFSGRVLPFGSQAALPYTRIAVARRRAGRPISQFDAADRGNRRERWSRACYTQRDGLRGLGSGARQSLGRSTMIRNRENGPAPRSATPS